MAVLASMPDRSSRSVQATALQSVITSRAEPDIAAGEDEAIIAGPAGQGVSARAADACVVAAAAQQRVAAVLP